MNFLTQLRIGQRLFVSFGLLILLLVAIGIFGASNAKRLANDLDRTANSSLLKIAAANELEGQVNIISRAVRDLLLLDTAGAIKKQKAAIAGALEQTEKQLVSLNRPPRMTRKRPSSPRSVHARRSSLPRWRSSRRCRPMARPMKRVKA